MNSTLPATLPPAGLHLLRAAPALRPFGLTVRAAEAAAADGSLPIRLHVIGPRRLRYVSADDVLKLAAHLNRPTPTTPTTGAPHAPNRIAA